MLLIGGSLAHGRLAPPHEFGKPAIPRHHTRDGENSHGDLDVEDPVPTKLAEPGLDPSKEDDLAEIRNDQESAESPSAAAYLTVGLTELTATAGVKVPPAHAAQLLHVGHFLLTGVLVTVAPLLSAINLANAGQPPWLIAAIAVTQVVAVGVLSCKIKPSMTLKSPSG